MKDMQQKFNFLYIFIFLMCFYTIYYIYYILYITLYIKYIKINFIIQRRDFRFYKIESGQK